MKRYIVVISSLLMLFAVSLCAFGTTPFYVKYEGEYLVLYPDSKSNNQLATGIGGEVYIDSQLKNKANDTGVAGTGKYVSVSGKKYETVVIGDCDGDGLVLNGDLETAKKAFKKIELEEKEKLILDADENGKYTSCDYLKLKCHMLGVVKISETYKDPNTSDNSSSSEDSTVDPDWVNQCSIFLSDKGTAIEGSGASVSGKVISVTAGGEYTVSGKLSDGMIHVNSTEKVKIRLSGADLSNSTGPAIFFANAAKSYITIDNSTVNYLSDGKSYTNGKGTIFSETDLEIKGKGTLYVTANCKHAICCDDDLSIENGVIIINSAVKDGIHVKKSLEIIGGDITVKNCAGDGIDCQGTTSGQKGTVSISGGKITMSEITGDAINAFGDVGISGGTVSLLCSMDGIKTDGYVRVFGAVSLSIDAGSDGINSAKGIVVSLGNICINAVEYTLKSDDGISVTGGSLKLQGVKEKIYALGNVNIADGTVK